MRRRSSCTWSRPTTRCGPGRPREFTLERARIESAGRSVFFSSAVADRRGPLQDGRHLAGGGAREPRRRPSSRRASAWWRAPRACPSWSGGATSATSRYLRRPRRRLLDATLALRRRAHARMSAVILERSSHPQFVSNTYLLADGDGGPALLHRRRRPGRAADRGRRATRPRADTRAADPPPLRPRQRGRRAARALAGARGADQPARARADLRGRRRRAEGRPSQGIGSRRGGRDPLVRGARGPAAAARRGTPPACSRSSSARGAPVPAPGTSRATGRRLHRGHALPRLGGRRQSARPHAPTPTCATRSWAR